LTAISGAPPDLAAPPAGCRFHPRCALAEPQCIARIPPLEQIAPEHMSACRRHEVMP
jgi:peptide/nickel transport system ATP-binding protein